MATLNEIGRERKRMFRQLKQQVRTVDTTVEEIQRTIDRNLARKRTVIETKDFEKLIQLFRDLEMHYLEVIRGLEVIARVFRL